jgi:hypothetical protein
MVMISVEKKRRTDNQTELAEMQQTALRPKNTDASRNPTDPTCSPPTIKISQQLT